MLKPKQLNFIELLIANPLLPDTELAKKIGVNRNTLHVWKTNAEFQAAYKQRLNEVWQDSERAAIDTMQSLARAGDFKANKYILDSLGYAPTQRVEATISQDIVINIGD